VNFSAESTAAVESGAALARLYGAAIDLVTVVEPPPLYARVITPVQASIATPEKAAEEAREKLEQIAAELEGQTVSCVARIGSAFAELITHCREHGTDLLVIGVRSDDSGLRRLVLGSTAERVLRKAPIPVLAVKKRLPPRPEVVLAPTDFSPMSRPALHEAAVLARHWGARLILLHAIEPITQVYGWGADLVGSEVFLFEPEAIEPEWQSLLSEVDLNNVRWEQRTEQGLAANTICRVAADEKAELIVIATHGRTALSHALLGSVAEAVLRQAPCSVLSVRSEAVTFTLP
jgi:nucleotide-binding universal stress UspA family protein